MSRDYSIVRYFIDSFGRLWMGPICRDENLHYATFHGYTDTEESQPIWILERTDQPEDADEVNPVQAGKTMAMFCRLKFLSGAIQR